MTYVILPGGLVVELAEIWIGRPVWQRRIRVNVQRVAAGIIPREEVYCQVIISCLQIHVWQQLYVDESRPCEIVGKTPATRPHGVNPRARKGWIFNRKDFGIVVG